MELYRALPKENQAAVKALDSDRMMNALTPLVKNRMLLARAEAAHLKLDPEREKMLAERLEGVAVTEMLRNEVKVGAVVSDSAVRAVWATDSLKYPGKTYEQAAPEIQKALLAEKMQRVNTQAGQRELVHQLAKKMEATVKVERFPDNYELVLAQLAPVRLGQRRREGSGRRRAAGSAGGRRERLAGTFRYRGGSRRADSTDPWWSRARRRATPSPSSGDP